MTSEQTICILVEHLVQTTGVFDDLRRSIGRPDEGYYQSAHFLRSLVEDTENMKGILCHPSQHDIKEFATWMKTCVPQNAMANNETRFSSYFEVMRSYQTNLALADGEVARRKEEVELLCKQANEAVESRDRNIDSLKNELEKAKLDRPLVDEEVKQARDRLGQLAKELIETKQQKGSYADKLKTATLQKNHEEKLKSEEKRKNQSLQERLEKSGNCVEHRARIRDLEKELADCRDNSLPGDSLPGDAEHRARIQTLEEQLERSRQSVRNWEQNCKRYHEKAKEYEKRMKEAEGARMEIA